MHTYSAHDVHTALPWQSLDSALTVAFAEGAESPLRHTHALNATDSLLLMPAWNQRYIGVKVVTVMPMAAAQNAPTVGANYLLLDRTTGRAQALLDGEALTVRRTAMVSAIAARYMARTDARVLLMVGCGRLAPWLVRAHCALRPDISQVVLWGRNHRKVEAAASALRAEGLPVQSATDLPEAVNAADMISCATTATEPIVQSDWVRAGTHLDLVGGFTPTMREVDDTLVGRSRVVVDSYDGALREAGDLTQPMNAGFIGRDHVVAELAELVRGERAGRMHADEVTLFKSVGTALADLAAAALVCREHEP